MSSGTCLCGSVTWEISGKPEASYNCHCKICRKAHGAAFGTYWYVMAENFRWTSSLDTVVKYASSADLNRGFCVTCGSVVPDVGGDDSYFVPAGCHDEGSAPNSHIFVAHKAPWYDITGSLPRHDDFEPGDDNPLALPDKELPPPREGVVRGSCLCGAIEFEVVEPFKVVHNCHCMRCRRARAAAHTTNGFTSMEGVRFLKGEEHIKTYKVPDARFFTHTFCDTCGSGMPRIDPGRQIAVTPLGALDDDPQANAVDNIFVGSKAGWYEITDDLPAYDEAPPG